MRAARPRAHLCASGRSARVRAREMSATPVGKALEKVIWEVHQCEQIIAAGGYSDDRIVDKLEDLVKALPSLREAAAESERADDDARSATLLPVSALRLVDEGRCPTRGMVDGLLAVGEANAATKGKTNVFARLHAELEAQNEAQPRAEAPAVAKATPAKETNAAAKETPTKRKRGR